MNPFDQPGFARALFDENGDALFLVDPDTDAVLDVNRTGLRLSGFPKHELVGVRATDLFRYDHGAGGGGRLKQAAEATVVFHAQGGFQMRTRPSPGWLPVTVTVARLHVKPKTLALYTVQDDSERRQAIARATAAEREMRAREARFRALVENSHDGVVILSPDAIVRYASPAVAGVLGYSADELVGRPGLDLVHPDDAGRVADRLAAVVRGEPGGPSVCRLRTKAAAWRQIEMNGTNALADPDVGGVVVNFRDVTERVRAETEIRRQHALLDALFDAAPDVVAVKDRRLTFLAGNAAFERLAGRPVGEVFGRTCTEAFPDPWAARLEDVERRVLAAGTPARAEEWVTYPDGSAARLDVIVCPLPADDGGPPAGLVVLGRDVTDQRRLEDQLRHAQKMEAVGQLAGGVAHDFNNLLTVVLGNLEMARAERRGPPLDDLLRSTDKAARRAAQLTGQLLGFARRQPMTFRAVGVDELIRDTVALIRRSIDPRIVMRVGDAAGTVWADPGQVNQVLMNLCLNARDAMPDGGTLAVSAGPVLLPATAAPPARPGRFVRLTVTDTGVGMPPDVQARIFEPFYTTKGTGRGTGLGLAVVFGIVQAHGGWIACHSEPGAGTRFDVYLPPHDGPAAAAQPSAVGKSPLGRGERVLVVDDEPMIRTLARTVLEALNYRVTEAEDGAAGVRAYADADPPFDLVLMDLTMPNLSGRDALAELRRMDAGVRVVLASGYSADREAIAAEGVSGFLDKPYTPTELARVVRQTLDGAP